MTSLTKPLDLFTHVVSVDCAEFRSKPDDLRLAFHACISLLSLRDWIYEVYQQTNWTWQGAPQNPISGKISFQSVLEGFHPEFAIISDVANASKHLILDVKRKRSTALGVANVSIQTFVSISGGSLLNSAPLNTATLNQAPTISTSNVAVVETATAIFHVVQSANTVEAIWTALIAENGWT